MATIGLIAGGGRFPLLFAESARRAGHRVVAAAHVNQTDPALEKLVDAFTWVKLGQFGKVLDVLKAAGCTEVVMLGSITKARFFRDAWLDGLGVQIVARLAVKSDDNVLRAIAAGARGAGAAGHRPDRLPPGPAGPRGRDGAAGAHRGRSGPTPATASSWPAPSAGSTWGRPWW